MAQFRWYMAPIIGLVVCALAAPAVAEQSETKQEYSKPEYYDMRRLIVPVLEGDRLAGQISIIVVLELAEDADTDDISALERRLRNEYLMAMKEFADRRPGVLRSINVTAVKKLLLSVSKRVLGPGQVRAVLVQSVILRRY